MRDKYKEYKRASDVDDDHFGIQSPENSEKYSVVIRDQNDDQKKNANKSHLKLSIEKMNISQI